MRERNVESPMPMPPSRTRGSGGGSGLTPVTNGENLMETTIDAWEDELERNVPTPVLTPPKFRGTLGSPGSPVYRGPGSKSPSLHRTPPHVSRGSYPREATTPMMAVLEDGGDDVLFFNEGKAV